jgi:hypothetical protein
MQKTEIALILSFSAALAWPWLRMLFTWKTGLIVVLGVAALWQLFKA